MIPNLSSESCTYAPYTYAKAPAVSSARTSAVNDIPRGPDRLGYTIYSKAIAEAVASAEAPNSSMSVGIYAQWGGGKSFLMHKIKEEIEGLAMLLSAA